MSSGIRATKRRNRPRRASGPAASPPNTNPQLAAFMRAAPGKNQASRAIAICYHLEEKEGLRPITAPIVRRAYLSVPIKPPANIPRLLAKMATDGLLVRLHPARPEYVLSDSARQTFKPLLAQPPSPIEPLIDQLRQQTAAISDKDEKEYLEEALTCLHAGALRAAIVMGWTAAVWNLRGKVAAVGLSAFNSEFSRRWPQSKKGPVKAIDDFEDYRDEELLQVSEGIGVISKAVLAELLTHLKLRNSCGHPTAVRPKLNRVAAFFEDLLQYVLLVARP